MSEKRFLNFIFIEGLMLVILGLCILILPKLTSLSFGVMLSSAFIAYGIYKIVTSIINRGYATNVVWCVFLGAFLTTIGILLLFVPKISLLWLIALTGVFFVLESISATVFMSHVRTMLNHTGCKYMGAIILFLIGLTIILGLPVMSFWIVAILSGVALLVKGMAKMVLSITNRNNYNV